MSGVKKIDLFLVSLLPGQQHTEAEMVWSSPQQCVEERERDIEGGGGGGGYDRRRNGRSGVFSNT